MIAAESKAIDHLAIAAAIGVCDWCLRLGGPLSKSPESGSCLSCVAADFANIIQSSVNGSNKQDPAHSLDHPINEFMTACFCNSLGTCQPQKTGLRPSDPKSSKCCSRIGPKICLQKFGKWRKLFAVPQKGVGKRG